jgi:hypothetical protein
MSNVVAHERSLSRSLSIPIAIAVAIAIAISSILTIACDTATEPGATGPDTTPPAPPGGPPAGTVYAVDVSHWSGQVSEGQVACWWNEGIRHVVAGTQDSAISVQQLQVASSSGMTVDAYVVLEWDQDVTTQVERALGMIAPYPVRRLWLDAERSADGRSAAEMVDLIRQGVDACDGFPCGIYTGKGWWLRSTGNSMAFSYLPLWYPRYNGQADFEEWYEPSAWYEGPFGGWEHPSGKQCDSSGTAPELCNVNVDYNIMYTGGSSAAVLKVEVGRARMLQAGPRIWHPVDLARSFVHPVVIMQPLSYNSESPAMVRLRNVTGRGFEFQIDEWDYLNSVHTFETIGYLVVEAGVHRLEDGRFLEAGTVGAGSTFSTVDLSAPFEDEPVILAQAQTNNELSAVVTRQRGATGSGFQLKLQEEEASDGVHAEETVGYLAVAPGAGTLDGVRFEAWHGAEPVSSSWTLVSFSRTYAGPVLVAGIETYNDGDPAGLSPSGGQQISTSAVTLSCYPIAGATKYEFEIEYRRSGEWTEYHVYRAAENSKTFWPYVENSRYRWRVRAQNTAGWGERSVWAYFVFGDI